MNCQSFTSKCECPDKPDTLHHLDTRHFSLQVYENRKVSPLLCPLTLVVSNIFNIWFSAFPTGGYSHSYGFESATKHGFVTDLSEYATQMINSYFSDLILNYPSFCHFLYCCSFSIDAFKVFVLSCLQNAGMPTGTFVLLFSWF